MRAALAARPDLPIFLSEYASFSDLPPNGPQSRHEGAMRFFRDVKGLLEYRDVTKVYWAQWRDAGDAPGMGLLTFDGHRKAIFNAFKIYGMMPVDRIAVTPDGANGVNLFASADARNAGVVLWNEKHEERAVTVNVRNLPFARGTMQLFRVDQNNACYLDNPASENLQVLQSLAFKDGNWSGTIPGESVVFLRLLSPSVRPAPFLPTGTWLRNYHWFPDRGSDGGADFDPRTGIARLSMGSHDLATSQIAVLMGTPRRRLRVQVKKSGSFVAKNLNSLLGLRFDFPSRQGGYSKSVLFHGGLYDARRDAVLPWGTAATPDETHFLKAFNTERPFEVNLSRLAPADWNQERILITFILRNAGRGARASITIGGSPKLDNPAT